MTERLTDEQLRELHEHPARFRHHDGLRRAATVTAEVLELRKELADRIALDMLTAPEVRAAIEVEIYKACRTVFGVLGIDPKATTERVAALEAEVSTERQRADKAELNMEMTGRASNEIGLRNAELEAKLDRAYGRTEAAIEHGKRLQDIIHTLWASRREWQRRHGMEETLVAEMEREIDYEEDAQGYIGSLEQLLRMLTDRLGGIQAQVNERWVEVTNAGTLASMEAERDAALKDVAELEAEYRRVISERDNAARIVREDAHALNELRADLHNAHTEIQRLQAKLRDAQYPPALAERETAGWVIADPRHSESDAAFYLRHENAERNLRNHTDNYVLLRVVREVATDGE